MLIAYFVLGFGIWTAATTVCAFAVGRAIHVGQELDNKRG